MDVGDLFDLKRRIVFVHGRFPAVMRQKTALE